MNTVALAMHSGARWGLTQGDHSGHQRRNWAAYTLGRHGSLRFPGRRLPKDDTVRRLDASVPRPVKSAAVSRAARTRAPLRLRDPAPLCTPSERVPPVLAPHSTSTDTPPAPRCTRTATRRRRPWRRTVPPTSLAKPVAHSEPSSLTLCLVVDACCLSLTHLRTSECLTPPVLTS